MKCSVPTQSVHGVSHQNSLWDVIIKETFRARERKLATFSGVTAALIAIYLDFLKLLYYPAANSSFLSSSSSCLLAPSAACLRSFKLMKFNKAKCSVLNLG